MNTVSYFLKKNNNFSCNFVNKSKVIVTVSVENIHDLPWVVGMDILLWRGCGVGWALEMSISSLLHERYETCLLQKGDAASPRLVSCPILTDIKHIYHSFIPPPPRPPWPHSPFGYHIFISSALHVAREATLWHSLQRKRPNTPASHFLDKWANCMHFHSGQMNPWLII